MGGGLPVSPPPGLRETSLYVLRSIVWKRSDGAVRDGGGDGNSFNKIALLVRKEARKISGLLFLLDSQPFG